MKGAAQAGKFAKFLQPLEPIQKLVAGIEKGKKKIDPILAKVKSKLKKPDTTFKKPVDLSIALGYDKAIKFAKAVIKPEPGWFDIIIHGSPNKVGMLLPNGEKLLLNHKDLAKIAKKRVTTGSLFAYYRVILVN